MPTSKNPASPATANWLQQARDHWLWRGQAKPPFAVMPGSGQVSVWDFPRPPRVQPDTREVVVRWGGIELARSKRCFLVCETAHPPSFYLPWDDVNRSYFERAQGGSFCEWKGPATYWTLVNGDDQLAGQAWSYPQPMAGADPDVHPAGALKLAGPRTRTPAITDGSRKAPPGCPCPARCAVPG